MLLVASSPARSADTSLDNEGSFELAAWDVRCAPTGGAIEGSHSLAFDGAALDAHAEAGADADREADADATLSCAPDTPEPTLIWARATVATPLDLELSGAALLEGTATAERGYRVDRVTIHVDDHYLGEAEGTTEWTFALDTTRLLDGHHALRVVAFAAPEIEGLAAAVGFGSVYAFSSFNDVETFTIFHHEGPADGLDPRVVTAPLAEDLMGLRITYRATSTSDVPLIGQLGFTYKETPGEGSDDAPTRTWTTTRGLVSAHASIVRAPYGGLTAPGVFAIAASFQGEGEVFVLVEAIKQR